MQEMERVLGWMRGRWTGGVEVLVDVGNYMGPPGDRDIDVMGRHVSGTLYWLPVERVVDGNAAPYPVRCKLPRLGGIGQWSFHEVIDLRFWDLADLRVSRGLGINYPGHPEWDPFPDELEKLSELSTLFVPERTSA